MKTLINTKHLFALALMTAVTFSACSSVNNEVESLSEADIQLAADIVSNSLADQQSGMVSSLYDAFSSVDDQGITYGGGGMNKMNQMHEHSDHSGRGHEGNFSHTYDPVTGIHTISYDRSVTREYFSKSVSVDQEIIFTGIEGNFLARPRVNSDSLESVDFTGIKTGTHEGLYRSSNFTKIDTMYIAGIHPTSGTLTMDGNHHGFGRAEGVLDDNTQVSRNYDIRITFENVAINKDTVQAYGNLEQGVSGTLTYSIVMKKTVGGVPEETIVEGTIDLQEDGTALLRFNKIPRVIRFSLRDGQRQGS